MIKINLTLLLIFFFDDKITYIYSLFVCVCMRLLLHLRFIIICVIN